MKKLLAILLASALGLSLLSGCSGSDGAEELTAPLKAASSTSVYDGTFQSVTAFGLRLMAQTAGGGADDPLLSPLSAYLALSMAADGAAGDTAAQFNALLGAAGGDRDALCRALSDSLAAAQGDTEVSIAQSLWADEAARLEEDYLQQMVDVFSAQAFSADLDTDGARKAINRWVKDRTQGLIPSLLEENLTEDAALVLLNTLYFDGAWETPFEQANTAPMDFRREDGAVVSLEFLNRTAYLEVVENGSWEGVLVPYDGGGTAFLALKPKADLRTLAANLTAEEWQALLDSAQTENVALAMPKLDVTFSCPLDDALKALGLTAAFDPDRADFSPMGTGKDGAPLFFSTVFQKVKLTADEERTKAAAVTGIFMSGSSSEPLEPRSMVFDSPYLYAVVDLESGVPLFLGLATHL